MRKRSVLYLQVSVALYSLAANFAHPIEPAFFQKLNLPDYTFGVAFACMAFACFLFSPFWGKIAERIGIAKVMAIGYGGYALGQFFFLQSGNAWEVALARLFAGFFIAAVMDCQIMYILAVEKAEKTGASLAVMASVSAVFSAFGYLIGGLIGSRSVRLAIVAQIVGLALIGILVLIFLEDQERKTAGGRLSLKTMNPFSSFVEMKGIMSRMVVLFLAVALITSLASNCYDQCFNYFIRDQYGFEPSMNGILKGISGVITLAANTTVSVWLLKKTDIFQSIVPVFLVCALMLVGIVVSDAIVPFVVLNVVLFGFNAIYKPLLQAMIGRLDSGEQGILVGAYNGFNSVGSVIGSLVAGFTYVASPRGSFVAAAVCFAVAAIFAVGLRKEYERQE